MLLRAASKNEGGGKLTQADVGFGGRKFIVCWEGGRGSEKSASLLHPATKTISGRRGKEEKGAKG